MKSQEWNAIKTAYEIGYQDFVDDINSQIQQEMIEAVEESDINEDPQFIKDRVLVAKTKISTLKNILEEISGKEQSVVKKNNQVAGL